MGDLEEVEPRQAIGQQRRVDGLLDVARQQESGVTRRAEQDH
jgi:hypothetical protein